MNFANRLDTLNFDRMFVGAPTGRQSIRRRVSHRPFQYGTSVSHMASGDAVWRTLRPRVAVEHDLRARKIHRIAVSS
ncbi:hypothetical protein KEH56_36640 [Burkholderia cenocepacia]|uniref:hypothetical protein n=1 Tax=Burkholderia cenocepacia TaxID=95486 RepID=UPI001BA4E4BE|nr:hypothetical protein [Burkholderia cenocepacia]QUN44700.1 hypothetical protein KEH56_36640 [Burkholderia cenocepacia]